MQPRVEVSAEVTLPWEVSHSSPRRWASRVAARVAPLLPPRPTTRSPTRRGGGAAAAVSGVVVVVVVVDEGRGDDEVEMPGAPKGVEAAAMLGTMKRTDQRRKQRPR